MDKLPAYPFIFNNKKNLHLNNYIFGNNIVRNILTKVYFLSLSPILGKLRRKIHFQKRKTNSVSFVILDRNWAI